MDNAYADTVRLLLAVSPAVFAGDLLAMKGGTAINLFLRDMPRLSVDIDAVYVPRDVRREDAVHAIRNELTAVAKRAASMGLRARLIGARDQSETKLVVGNDVSQVKVEVNLVFRGTVLPVERRALSARTADLFGVEFDVPILAPDELYAGKLVAALDRQHPRDLFDVWQLYESGGITDGMVECFVVYLAGHNRPTHEVLFGNDKDIAAEYDRAFVGMTEVDCSLKTLTDTRNRLRQELPARLAEAHKHFLLGLSRGAPDWSLLQCGHAAELPALRWKLSNLETFRQRRPAEFARHVESLEASFAGPARAER
ncbi:nucleotidyl transferase AbiEii/AbiGii toxin family protein [Cupriavidus gilardii]|uniref:nucleotidyl transferase AbiEii/AbiGii toxin family protein n=1 Tax=Cupriavidus gilardii TaxID=82541 RepID=UPI001ABE4041|nr:nucleotidyl transferase AbiEii/AbiGii toxin family protein [Cupriavidus gilardii]MBO4119313.1 nucleotidyl transferase AbiEii/AbiGii toxin family protein [Cupriavidus gilardii]